MMKFLRQFDPLGPPHYLSEENEKSSEYYYPSQDEWNSMPDWLRIMRTESRLEREEQFRIWRRKDKFLKMILLCYFLFIAMVFTGIVLL